MKHWTSLIHLGVLAIPAVPSERMLSSIVWSPLPVVALGISVLVQDFTYIVSLERFIIIAALLVGSCVTTIILVVGV